MVPRPLQKLGDDFENDPLCPHNPTHQPLKIDLIRWIGLNQVGFDRLAG